VDPVGNTPYQNKLHPIKKRLIQLNHLNKNGVWLKIETELKYNNLTK
jgi:hypothetical protein